MSKRKKKAVSLAGIGRTSQNVDLRPVEIDDPFEPGKKMTAVKNVETTPLDAEFHVRKNLTPEQYQAGNRFLALWEKIEIGGARAIDYSRLKVDVSFQHRDVSIGAAEAQEELQAIRAHVGRRSYELLVSIVGNRIPIDALAKSEPVKWRREMMSYHLRKCLKETLQEVCDLLGIVAKGRARGTIRAEKMEDAA